jgi:diguanylate cyclase (GGDEF)-like protein/PAS domain S-box-containing protein
MQLLHASLSWPKFRKRDLRFVYFLRAQAPHEARVKSFNCNKDAFREPVTARKVKLLHHRFSFPHRQMKKNLEIYRSIAEQAADSIFVTDSEGKIVYQNPEARRVFGYSDDEIGGHTILEMIHHHHPDGTPVHPDECKIYRAAAHGETSRDFIWMVFRKDGSRFYASCTSSPIHVEGQRIGAVFFVTDITARREAEENLMRSSEKLAMATEAAEIGMFDFNPRTKELIWTEMSRRHFGLPPDAPVSYETFWQGIHPDDAERVRKILHGVYKRTGDGRYQYEYRTVSPTDGRIRWVAARGQAFYDASGNAVRMVGTTMDVTERKMAEIRLREAMQHDGLTGLPNRTLMAEYSEHLLAHAKRVGAESALLFVDLDRFKPINDLYGHDVGDQVLQEVANRLRSCTRKEDVVCRLGGDEFIVMLPRIQTSEDPETVAQHIIDKLSAPFYVDALELGLSASIGISIFMRHGDNMESLIRCADLAMYAAKQEGRRAFKVYSPGYDKRVNERLHLEMQLKERLESGNMVLLYQPIVDVESGRLIAAEALIRMPKDDGELLHPDEFIPLAESTGLINKLGYWVCEEACRQYREWRSAGLPPFGVAINVSAMEFRQRSFAERLARVLQQEQVDPAFLQIELTESAVMSNVADAIATLSALRAMGVKVALDDFGTGYSSLSHLRRLPLDKLKIDQSFLIGIESDEGNQSIADAIIGLGRTMGLEVVGEGIESAQAMNYLKDHGCHQAQGYLFSEPLPVHEFESWCREHTQLYH